MDILRIGTRGSPLALVQAKDVQEKIRFIQPDLKTEIVPILTSGDWKPEHGEKRLDETQGGKGLFAKEIEHALLDGVIDIAVHSMKDMETTLPQGLVIPFVMEREDARDCIILSKKIANNVQNVGDLPQGCVVGTSSVRRKAFLLHRRPDLTIVPLRGNVQTRLDKLQSGQVDATLLAAAGLNRLGMQACVAFELDERDFVPAASQGAVCIEILDKNKEKLAFLNQLNHEETQICVEIERAALAVLDGSCHTPVGAHAYYSDLEAGRLTFDLCVASLGGEEFFQMQGQAVIRSIQDAKEFGASIARQLKPKITAGILS